MEDNEKKFEDFTIKESTIVSEVAPAEESKAAETEAPKAEPQVQEAPKAESDEAPKAGSYEEPKSASYEMPQPEKKDEGGFFHLSSKGALALVIIVILLCTSFCLGTLVSVHEYQRDGKQVFKWSLGKDKAEDEYNVFDEEERDVHLGAAPRSLESATGAALTIPEIVDATADSIVEIKTEMVATDIWLREFITSGAGSGIIASEDGYIITNNHVINNAQSISVTTKDGTEYEAVLVATDPQTDVAVIKVEAEGLTPVVFGDSDDLVVGELAVVIGNPLGTLGGTVTAGIVSALNREITIDGKTMTLIQTDAAINQGNSGGGVFDGNGELIGMVVAKSAGSTVEGLGFFIPVNTVQTVANQLAQHGYVKGRVMMGIKFVDLTTIEAALQYGVRNLGIYVSSLESDNAKASGLKEGDMLYYIDDIQIKSAADIAKALEGHEVGDKIKITVVRDDTLVDLTLTLSEKKE